MKNISINIHQVNFGETSIEEIPLTPFKTDWFGEAFAHVTEYKIAADEQFLLFYFQSNKKAVFNPEYNTRKITKNLWKYDVAELFFLNTKTGRYQEFNFAPTGAYWSAVFSDYRKMETEVPFHPVSICTNKQENYWEIEIKFSLQDIGIGKITDPEVQLNICSILYDPKPTFLSQGKVLGNPDFHNDQAFCPIEFIGL